MYAYVLALFYSNEKLMPKTVNSGMEFEYALARQAFKEIADIGGIYFSKDPTDYSKNEWQTFK